MDFAVLEYLVGEFLFAEFAVEVFPDVRFVVFCVCEFFSAVEPFLEAGDVDELHGSFAFAGGY